MQMTVNRQDLLKRMRVQLQKDEKKLAAVETAQRKHLKSIHKHKVNAVKEAINSLQALLSKPVDDQIDAFTGRVTYSKPGDVELSYSTQRNATPITTVLCTVNMPFSKVKDTSGNEYKRRVLKDVISELKRSIKRLEAASTDDITITDNDRNYWPYVS